MGRKKEAIGIGVFILALLLGDIYARDLLKWVWIIGIAVLFVLFFIFVYDRK